MPCYMIQSLIMIYTCFRNVETGQPELMVNFVTSSYKPELLKPLVEKITGFPDVVSGWVIHIIFMLDWDDMYSFQRNWFSALDHCISVFYIYLVCSFRANISYHLHTESLTGNKDLYYLSKVYIQCLCFLLLFFCHLMVIILHSAPALD